jgi:2,4-dichlorophenol 6-monooxygenase
MPEDGQPVTVIGAGPAGLITSLLLSRYGIPHTLVEKYPSMAHTPRAHIINQRTVEIFRDLGLEDALLSIAMPWDLMGNTVWHTSLSGTELGRRQSWGTSPDRHADYVQSSPCPMANCGQHLLEPALLAEVQRSPFAEVLLNHEFVALEQDGSGVSAIVRDRSDGDRRRLRSQYLVGADGGRSRVAEEIGLNYLGEEGISASATIHFHADLTRFTARRPGALYFNATPGEGGFRGAGTLICHQPWHDWALAYSYDPALLDPTDVDSARERIYRIIGDRDVEFTIHNISTWTINHLVAREYSAGRVFCMGDAVHRHPPFNGLGLNTSVADAYNLAWKLALVLNGSADPDLLATYTEERQPVGQQVVDRANASIDDLRTLQEAFAFDAGQPAPEDDDSIGRLFEPSSQGCERRHRISEALAATDYQFNAHGVEMGYRYHRGAIVSDGTAEPEGDRDPELFYQRTTWPGARLPHAYLDDGRRRISTIDLVGTGHFALLTGIGGEPWLDAAHRASLATGVDIDVYFIGTRDGLVDCYGDWSLRREVETSGCVLVRPDRHVAWRARSASPDLVDCLPAVMARILRQSTTHDRFGVSPSTIKELNR